MTDIEMTDRNDRYRDRQTDRYDRRTDTCIKALHANKATMIIRIKVRKSPSLSICLERLLSSNRDFHAIAMGF